MSPWPFQWRVVVQCREGPIHYELHRESNLMYTTAMHRAEQLHNRIYLRPAKQADNSITFEVKSPTHIIVERH